ncbi:uncharacterized protein SETTUDRAFT_22623 [Exserohilum turcica Et28A]|uniref:Uncharacterized protein n=1 Tax=Exserohilum turcicum (strain 28A) TaxID=671987 RepID=R0JYY3_EXST2|nr:uncharacterized protein SETTUDRAFT_22623 [Exserohilum turcica Et28A]EOA82644.1 hypothetical protein SETTUDRAFT_22623 [Exserohilum turcica Et28A]
MAYRTLTRRDEPTNIYNQIRLLDVYASNSAAVAGAIRIGLHNLCYQSAALERQVKEKSRQNKSYVEYAQRLQIRVWEMMEQLRQSKLRALQLQAELQSKRVSATGSRQRRQRRNGKKHKPHGSEYWEGR